MDYRYFTRLTALFTLLAGTALSLSVSSCEEAAQPEAPPAPTLAKTDQPVVYGVDGRDDIYAHGDPIWQQRALDHTVVLIGASEVDDSVASNVLLDPDGPTLQEYQNLCSTERFLTQPTAGFCSGTLIDDDLVLTAGHCITSEGACFNTRFVFNYAMDDADTLGTIISDDVFSCAALLVRVQSGGFDHAIVRLDRDATPRFTPATVRTAPTPVNVDDDLVVSGCPTGTPFKIDNSGWVRDNRAAELDYFVANLDTFGGNSGSGTFLDNGELVGILVRGETDYVSQGGCNVVNTCLDNDCRGEDSSYAFRAIDELCDLGVSTGNNLCSCGNTICDAGEGSTNCPQDCGGPVCDDGVCNGGETPATCTPDCGTCGNGDPDDDAPGTCCTDRPTDCGPGDICVANACVVDPGPGDICETAIPVSGDFGDYQYQDDTSVANNDYTGGCGGAGAPDRVYTFTVTVDTEIEANISGYDTVLYLGQDCQTTEVACNDDSTPPGNFGSAIQAVLSPGTYHLFVDGYADSAGAYTLSVGLYPSGGGPNSGVAFSDGFSGELSDNWYANGFTKSTGLHAQTGYAGNGVPIASAAGCNGGCELEGIRHIDLTDATSATLSFHRFVDSKLDQDDFLTVKACRSGSNCVELATWNGGNGDTNVWEGESFDLADWVGFSDLTLQFSTQTNRGNEFVQLDDIEVTYETAATDCGDDTCDAGAGEDCTSCPADCGNDCGGCATLNETLADPCPDCGTIVCDGTDATMCNDPGFNGCGGCDVLSNPPNTACGECAVFECSVDPNTTICGADPGYNACGGCGPVDNPPGDSCGDCGTYVCTGPNTAPCSDPGFNACGAPNCGPVPFEVCDDGEDNDCDGDIDEGCGVLPDCTSELTVVRAEYQSSKNKVVAEVQASISGSGPAVIMTIAGNPTAYPMSLKRSNRWKKNVGGISSTPATLTFESTFLGCQLETAVTVN